MKKRLAALHAVYCRNMQQAEATEPRGRSVAIGHAEESLARGGKNKI